MAKTSKAPKVDSTKILAGAKTTAPDKKNYTFRLPTELMNDLEKVCKSQRVKPTSVLIGLINSFLEDVKA